MSAPLAEMKMWIISVAPMPSMMRMPVASYHASEVAFGSASPAEMQRRRLEMSRPPTIGASAR